MAALHLPSHRGVLTVIHVGYSRYCFYQSQNCTFTETD